jgi:hypothetical protein
MALWWCVGNIVIFYAAQKRALTQARVDKLAGSELGSRANQSTISILNQRIAPMKNFER